jgi:hypothetical protein
MGIVWVAVEVAPRCADAALRRDRLVVFFRGSASEKVLGGAAVVVEAPKTCQYYFFKFVKNVLESVAA